MLIAHDYQIAQLKSDFEAKLRTHDPYKERDDHEECKRVQHTKELEVESLQDQIGTVIEENKRVHFFYNNQIKEENFQLRISKSNLQAEHNIGLPSKYI
jgi:hypothetical protein